MTENSDRKSKSTVKKVIKLSNNVYDALKDWYSKLQLNELMSIKGSNLLLVTKQKFKLSGYLKEVTK